MKNQLVLRITAVAGGLLLTVAANIGRPAAQTVMITGTTTQLTFLPLTQWDPSLSNNIVVWTDSHTGNLDVYYCVLDECDVSVPVTSRLGDQLIHDVSGTLIVYTDQTGPPERVRVFDIVTGTDLGAVGHEHARNPRIDGALVAYEVGFAGASDIGVVDLTTGWMSLITSTAAIETSPVVSGSRVVFERRATVTGPGDIVIYDLTTETESVMTIDDDQRLPDIEGNTLVYDGVTSAGDRDIFIRDFATGITTQVVRPGDQMYPHVSGDVVSFDDIVASAPFEDRDVMLYHIPSGTVHPVATNPRPETGGFDFLNDISGNRIVYASNVAGSYDVWMYRFEIQLPEIAVAPLVHDFGDVALGTSATTIVTVSNLGTLPLSVSNVAFQGAGSAAFRIGTSLALPAVIEPDATLDVPVAFTPTASGPAAASLAITNDDLDEGVVLVALSGEGVAASATPLQQVADLLAFFDASVANGRLTGNGSGSSAQGRLNALKNMIEAAGELIQGGSAADACRQLLVAATRADGVAQPPDFATGSAAAELVHRILELRTTLGCS